MDKIIKAENLIYEYKSEETGEAKNAIDNISFEIEKGSFVAIIGRNGSGKSTLAKNINALLTPTGGTLWVNGYDTSDESFLWDIRRSAGMVFQNPDNQLVSTIVEDDVAFGPENLGLDPAHIRERVDEALKAVDMYEFRNKAPHLLSGGQKQRVAIAGIVAMKPECIVLDEPTAMLDPRGRREVMDIAHKLNAEGITVVLITHFMEEAMSADKIIIMHNGHIALQGTPAEVFNETETLKELSLDVPMSVQLANELRQKGIDIPKEVVSEEQLEKFITDTIKNSKN